MTPDDRELLVILRRQQVELRASLAKIDARLNSLLESHLEPLLAVNRQLALFLGEQLGNMIELWQSVCAMERLLEADPRRKSKYAAMLEKVKGLEEIQSTQQELVLSLSL